MNCICGHGEDEHEGEVGPCEHEDCLCVMVEIDEDEDEDNDDEAKKGLEAWARREP